MALRDIAGYEGIPINVHVADHWIHVIVGFGTPWMKKQSFYLQDTYRVQNNLDPIYNWIEEAIDEIKAVLDGDGAKSAT